MSDQENIKPDETDVEAHKKSVKLANEGEAQDDSTEDDVELHKKSVKLANDEGKDDDDVELHGRSRKLL
jgi:hypothetical protein